MCTYVRFLSSIFYKYAIKPKQTTSLTLHFQFCSFSSLSYSGRKVMSDEKDLDIWLEAAKELSKAAGEKARIAVQKENTVEEKSSYADLVTETDKQVEDFLRSGFLQRFPDHKFIGEESTSSGTKCVLTDDPTWIIDPIDGTMNFVHRFPYFAISIGLAVNKKIVVGVIYAPMFDYMYSAALGKGAFRNGKKLHVSAVKDLSKALIVTEVGSLRQPDIMDHVFTNFQTMASTAHGIRSLGSAALNLCAVASGEGDCYFEYTIHCWDMAAGKIIVEEAGGVVIDPEGGPLDIMSRRILCGATKSLVKSVSSKLSHVKLPRD